MSKKNVAFFILSGIILVVTAAVLIANVITNPGLEKVQKPDGTQTSASVPAIPSTPETPKETDSDIQTPPATADGDKARDPIPSDIYINSSIDYDVHEDEYDSCDFLKLDEMEVAGADNINVVNDLGRDIDEIFERMGEPEHQEVFYGSDAYIYSDITYITQLGDRKVIKIFVRDPYRFGDFKIGDSVKTVERIFGQPCSKTYSEEDDLWLMVYKVECSSERYLVGFYAESEDGVVVAIGVEKIVV